MNPYLFLFMVLIGTILFYAGNELMFNNISTLNWLEERGLFGVGFAGMCLALLGLLAAYQLAMNTLHTVFPEHLVRMYHGLHCERDKLAL